MHLTRRHVNCGLHDSTKCQRNLYWCSAGGTTQHLQTPQTLCTPPSPFRHWFLENGTSYTTHVDFYLAGTVYIPHLGLYNENPLVFLLPASPASFVASRLQANHVTSIPRFTYNIADSSLSALITSGNCTRRASGIDSTLTTQTFCTDLYD
jgi:hypothetical protein